MSSRHKAAERKWTFLAIWSSDSIHMWHFPCAFIGSFSRWIRCPEREFEAMVHRCLCMCVNIYREIYLDILTRAILKKRNLKETNAHNEDMNGQRKWSKSTKKREKVSGEFLRAKLVGTKLDEKQGKKRRGLAFHSNENKKEILHYLTQNRSKLGFFSCFFVFIGDEYTRARTHTAQCTTTTSWATHVEKTENVGDIWDKNE